MERITQEMLAEARGVEFTRLMSAYSRQVADDIRAERAPKNKTGGWSAPGGAK